MEELGQEEEQCVCASASQTREERSTGSHALTVVAGRITETLQIGGTAWGGVGCSR